MGLEFSNHVTLGDVVVILGIVAAVFANYFGMRARINELAKTVDELRRGRGLILGPNSDWPDAVRRCFGFVGRHCE